MNLLLNTPMEYRLAALFVVGVCAGSLANLAIYRLAWRSRQIGPFSPPVDGAPRRRLLDRLPVVGWWLLRRESEFHGRGFWIRPMVIELGMGAGLAALYWWEIARFGLLPPEPMPQPPPEGLLVALHAAFLSHAVLIWWMVATSMIDIDEKTIPDSLTVPGTWLGLLLAALLPWSLLPAYYQHGGQPLGALLWLMVEPANWAFLEVTSPRNRSAVLDQFPRWESLAIGLGCWWLWCVALMPRVWYGRCGLRRATRYFFARLVRESATYRLLLMGLVGSAAIAAVWYVGQNHWTGLITALVGMAASGGLVWLVRVIGAATLGREAMGFGDVTLMAMFGAFLGWQTCLMVFFLAPLAGLVIGLLQLLLFRETEIPYGPFLCLAAVVVIVRWAAIWQWAVGIFQMGWFVPLVVLICMALMAVMLGVWGLIRAAFSR